MNIKQLLPEKAAWLMINSRPCRHSIAVHTCNSHHIQLCVLPRPLRTVEFLPCAEK